MYTPIDELIYPIWGSEQWISEGWNKLTPEEKQNISERVEQLFKNGLPFSLIHEKQLYIYMFSLMAQLEVLAIQLPLRFAKEITNPYLKEKMRAQLLDEIFHAIVFTRVAFILSAPYSSPPAYNERIEEICLYVRSITCPKIGLAVMNLICESLVEEVFLAMYHNNIAPELFKVILDDEHRHVCETELYREIGLPDKETLEEHLKKLETLILSAFTVQSQYATAITALLGLSGGRKLINDVHQKHTSQLKKIGMTPSDEWTLAFHLGDHLNKEFKPQADDVCNEIYQELSEVEMSPIRKVLMTEFNSPGDPTMTAEFNLDISHFGFFDNQYPHELLTPLVMQAISYVLISNNQFRDFLSYKKIHRSKGAYVSIIEKLPDCADQVGTIFFRNCHELNVENLLEKIEQHKKLIAYAYKKREQLEFEFPELKEEFQSVLYNGTYDIYPFPAPGSYGVYLSNIGHLGYTKAKVPLSKHMGLHATLLAVQRTNVWNNDSKSFEIKDFLPISFSADIRVFDGLLPIPDLMNQAFQTMLQKMNKEKKDFLETSKLSNNDYNRLTDKLANLLLNQKKQYNRRKIISYLMSSIPLIKEIKRLYATEIKESNLNIADYIANHLITDYSKFDAEKLIKNQEIMKLIDKLLNENRELGYRMLCLLQTGAFDYIDTEATFNNLYQKVANSRLHKLVKLLPDIIG
ncbi:MAG: hypothetical protein C0446_13935 [Chitinophaga sp.]|nr:hypothetical protein [Chitinophaga sp.]